MASKYVKGLEAAVASKHVGNKYNERYKKALDKNPYTGPRGKSPGHMINARAVRKTGKRPSDILFERSAKNQAAAEAIRSAPDIKKYGYGGGESGFKGYTGGLRAKVAGELQGKANRQLTTAYGLKNKKF